MRSFGFYVEKQSFIHRVDPITKLIYICAIIAFQIISGNTFASLFCVLLGAALLAVGKVLKKALMGYAFIAFVLLTVIIIQGLFGVKNETPAFNLFGLTFYREGLDYALSIVLRVLNIIGAFLLLALTTQPDDLADSLMRAGLHPQIGYVIISVFQVIPQMLADMKTITDAQCARGMEVTGSLAIRARAFFALAGPVVLSALINTKERAMALEVRGFSSKTARTFLKEEPKFPYAYPVRAGLLAAVAVSIAIRMWAA